MRNRVRGRLRAGKQLSGTPHLDLLRQYYAELTTVILAIDIGYLLFARECNN
jgi:hypothetical protein